MENKVNPKTEKQLIDIAEYAKEGKAVPKEQHYKIMIDRQIYEVSDETMLGSEILLLAGKTPIERYQLNQRFNGGKVIKVPYDQRVDFTQPGLEKFMTIPLDQTEG